jgi:hypothetical protein
MAKKAVTPLTEPQRMLFAAILGGLDLGMALPDFKRLKRAAHVWPTDLDGMVWELWQGIILRCEPIEIMFLEECQGWFEEALEVSSTVEGVRRRWPKVASLVFAKGVLPVKKGARR